MVICQNEVSIIDVGAKRHLIFFAQSLSLKVRFSGLTLPLHLKIHVFLTLLGILLLLSILLSCFVKTSWRLMTSP